MMSKLLVLLLASCALGRDLFARTKQSYKVKGILMCGDQPIQDAILKLVDKDYGPDEYLAEGRSDVDGFFELSGHAQEYGDIDTVLKVYHRCLAEGNLCKRRAWLGLPDEFINSETPLDIGAVNLQLQYGSSEEIDCFDSI